MKKCIPPLTGNHAGVAALATFMTILPRHEKCTRLEPVPPYCRIIEHGSSRSLSAKRNLMLNFDNFCVSLDKFTNRDS